MSRCEEIRDDFSGYFDNTLSLESKKEVSHHLSRCMACSAEYRGFARTIEVIRAIPKDQPVMDLWPEFAVKMSQVEAERKCGPIVAARKQWAYFIARLSEGVILYTHAAAAKAWRRFSRYVINDPFGNKGR
jgi:anti-sigma factor RsiW